MSRVQKRKTVSISGDLYEKLRVFCASNGISIAGFVESVAREKVGMAPPTVKRGRVYVDNIAVRDGEVVRVGRGGDHGGVFTF